MEHNDFVAKIEQALGYFLVVASDDSAYIHVTSRSRVYVDYHREQKKLLRRAFAMEEEANPPSSIFVRHGCAQHGRSKGHGCLCIR